MCFNEVLWGNMLSNSTSWAFCVCQFSVYKSEMQNVDRHQVPEKSTELAFLLLPTYDSFDSYCRAPFNSNVFVCLFVCLLLPKNKASYDSKCVHHFALDAIVDAHTYVAYSTENLCTLSYTASVVMYTITSAVCDVHNNSYSTDLKMRMKNGHI